MKAKNNLELFKNEIMYEFKHHPRDLWDILSDIYLRKTDKKLCLFPEMLDWYADVPRETFEVTAEMYAFLKAYASSEFVSDEAPLDFSVSSSILIDIGVIPKKYSKMPLKEFIKIIRLKRSLTNESIFFQA